MTAIVATQRNAGKTLRHQADVDRSRHIRDKRTTIYVEQFERMTRMKESLAVLARMGYERPMQLPLLPATGEEYLDGELKLGAPLRLFGSDGLWMLVKRHEIKTIRLMDLVMSTDGVPADELGEEIQAEIEREIDEAELGLRIVMTQMRIDLGISPPAAGWEGTVHSGLKWSSESASP